MNPTRDQTDGDEEWLLESLQRYATYREKDLRDVALLEEHAPERVRAGHGVRKKATKKRTRG